MAITEIRLPEIGEGVTEGELIRYLVKVGDTVKADQPIAEVMTDKATVEVPSPQAGTIRELKQKEGQTIAVEAVLVTMDLNGIAPAQSSAPSVSPAAKTTSAPATGSESVIEVKLPEIGEGVSEGELIKWLVKPGESVKADQGIAEIMTDKATVEVPSPVAGEVVSLHAEPGSIVKVEATLLKMKSGGAKATVSAAVAATVEPVSKPAQATVVQQPKEWPPVAAANVLASPATRRLARESHVDINMITGSGPGGRVTREDVLAAMQSSGAMKVQVSAKPSFSGALEERVAIKGIRKKIAESMQKSKHTIPHFTIMDRADMDQLVAARERLKAVAEQRGGKITYLPFVMKAMAATVREFPEFNSSIDDAAQEIVYKKYLNIGFAADTPQGLLVPVIKSADTKTLFEIGQEVIQLGQSARAGKLKLDEMKGATITVTNIGAIGGTYATPIINHPEVAILGMYKLEETPFRNKDGSVGFKWTMNFTLTCDHRLIDGAVAARFLKAFIARIEDPSVLILDMI